MAAGAANRGWQRLADNGMRRMPTDAASSDESDSVSTIDFLQIKSSKSV